MIFNLHADLFIPCNCKKYVLLLFTAISSCFIFRLQAQNIPNYGFELGSGIIADQWTADYDVKRVSQYNGKAGIINPYEGSHFLQVTTRDSVVSGDPSIKIGTASVAFASNSAPDSIVFNSAYYPIIPEDGFTIKIDFMKYNSATHMSSLTQGNSFNGNKSDTWMNNTNSFFYFNGTKPEMDTIIVTIQSTNPGQHDPNTGQPLYGDGATLLIDNIKFVYNNTGIEETQRQLVHKIIPNPLSGQTSIFFTPALSSLFRFDVFDLQGRNVFTSYEQSEKNRENCIKWNATGIPAGVYFYQLFSGQEFARGKLTILE